MYMFHIWLQVDFQQYAFAMRRNSPWLPKINRAINAAIAEGLAQKSYKRHIHQQCVQSVKKAKESPLDLGDLGYLFAGAGAAGLALLCMKLYPLLKNYDRPRLPMKSVCKESDHVISWNPQTSSDLGLSMTNLAAKWSNISTPNRSLSPSPCPDKNLGSCFSLHFRDELRPAAEASKSQLRRAEYLPSISGSGWLQQLKPIRLLKLTWFRSHYRLIPDQRKCSQT